MSADPRDTINNSPMSVLQIVGVAITIGLNALDGFDVMSISFASPGISKEWGITKDTLGFVLSMELIGMALGSIFLGRVTDRIGRRNMILGCLCLMASGMFLVTTASDVVSLSLWRVLTGLGIGGMLAATNATVSELANNTRRSLCIALMVIGYPIGAVIGGTIVAPWLKGGDWRTIFEFGAIVTAGFIPLVWFFLPETIPFLANKQPANALARINATLARFGKEAVAALPQINMETARPGFAALFKPGLMAITVLVTLAYFMHVTTFYFILKWSPKIVTDMGFDPSEAGKILVWANVGGAIGGAVFGMLAQKFGLKRLAILTLVMSTVMVSAFGQSDANLQHLAWAAAIGGFFTNGSMVGLYSILARIFPTPLRATGTGFAIGMGRGGSVISPILAGLLFKAGYSVPVVAMMIGVGSLIGALILLRMPIPETSEN